MIKRQHVYDVNVYFKNSLFASATKHLSWLEPFTAIHLSETAHSLTQFPKVVFFKYQGPMTDCDYTHSDSFVHKGLLIRHHNYSIDLGIASYKFLHKSLSF